MLVAAYVAAGDERSAADCGGVRLERRAGARQCPASMPGSTPPVYTGKPPVILSAANKDAAARR